jgi:hypothetical protein
LTGSQDIELAEGLDGHFDCVLDGLWIGSVSPERPGLSSGRFDGLDHGGSRIGILGVSDRHLSAVGGEALGDGSTDSDPSAVRS